MCKQKGNSFCIELGAEVSAWSNQAPLAKPFWINESLNSFTTAYSLALEGKIYEARSSLKNSMDDALRTWFDIHAQNTGTWRLKAQNVSAPAKINSLDSVKVFTKFEEALFQRDNYRCRYCQSKVIPRKVFRTLQKLIGEEFLYLKGTNAVRSGDYLMFCATLDHVFPHSLGGRTGENNLVTCCWSCNYGKSSYTLAQLGLDDPFTRPVCVDSSWQGITGPIHLENIPRC